MKSNKEVPENVRHDLRMCLSTSQKEMGHMDAKIEGLEEQLTQLYETKSRLQEHIDRFECVLSPIRRVPTDVLHTIFFHCLPTGHDPIISAREAPLLLTRICRVWRQTAFTSPSLWAKIYITFSDEGSHFDPQISYGLTKQHLSNTLRLRCSAVEQWLSRSGACPLSISILYTNDKWVFFDDQYPGNSTNTLMLFSILARFSSRWQKLKLKMPIEVYRILEAMVPVSKLSALTTFRASFTRQVTGNLPGDGQEISFFDSPNLATLSVTMPELWKGFRSMSSITSPNLTTLTDLSINRGISAPEAISLLQNCPNLECLALNLEGDSNHTATSSLPLRNMISLPLLHSVSIVECIHPTDAFDFYERIDAPHLERIEYSNQPVSHEFIHIIPIVRLLKKSSKLKNLLIQVDHYTSQDLRVILESAPSITHLVFGPHMRSQNDYHRDLSASNIVNWDMGEVFLPNGFNKDGSGEEMGCDSTSGLLPNLEVLEISRATATRLTDKTLLDILLSRLPGPNSSVKKTPMKKVAVVFARNPQEIDIFNEVMAYSQHQIKLEIQYLERPVPAQFSVSPGYGITSGTTTWYIEW